MKTKVFIITLLLELLFPPVSARSEFPVFAYDLYGKWGYCYQCVDFVQPCYDNAVDLGSTQAAFWAQQDGKWGLRRVDNSEIIPFVFDDVCVATRYQSHPLDIYLDSIEMFDRGVILPAVKIKRDYHYLSPSEDYPFFPLLPVKKDDKWGYVDFRGNTVIPFEYDEAFIFTMWLRDDKKRRNWLAEVRKGNQSAWIDVLGQVIIPWQENRSFSEKEIKKYLKKRKKETTQAYDTRIVKWADRMDSVLVVGDYVNQFDEEIQIAEIKPPVVKQQNTKSKSKSKRKSKSKKTETTSPKVKTRYTILYADGTPVIPDTLDKVFEREGDAVRVKIGDKMRVLNLSTGWLNVPAFDSIAPFDNRGRASAWIGNDEYTISLYGSLNNPNHSYHKYLSEIGSALTKYNWEEAAKSAAALSDVLPYYGSSWFRVMSNSSIRSAAEKYNFHCNPVKIAERQRIAAEEEAAKAAQKKESGWSLLGDLLSTVGSLSDSETSQSLKALGESIKEVAEPSDTKSESSDYAAADAESVSRSADISTLQAQVDAINQELDQVSTRQVQLAHERLNAKAQVSNAGALGAKTQTGSNATRNFSASRARRNAQQRAKAQVPAKNRLSSIDTQIQQLNERKTALLSQRAQLNKQIAQLTGEVNDSYSSQESSSKKATEQEPIYNQNINESSRRHLNTIGRELSELYTKYTDDTQAFTSSDRSRVKSLQAEARRVRKECLEQGGSTLPSNHLESWNP